MPLIVRPIFSLSTSIKQHGLYAERGLLASSSASITPTRPAPTTAMLILGVMPCMPPSLRTGWSLRPVKPEVSLRSRFAARLSVYS